MNLMEVYESKSKINETPTLWAVCTNVDQSWSRIDQSWIKETTT